MSIDNTNVLEKSNIKNKYLTFNYKDNKVIYSDSFKNIILNWKNIFEDEKIDLTFNQNKNSIMSISTNKKNVEKINDKFYDTENKKEEKKFKKIFEDYIQIKISENNAIEYFDKFLIDREKELFKIEISENLMNKTSISINNGFFNSNMLIYKLYTDKNNDIKLITGYDSRKYSYLKSRNLIILVIVILVLGILIGWYLLVLKKKRAKIIEQFDYEKLDQI